MLPRSFFLFADIFHQCVRFAETTGNRCLLTLDPLASYLGDVNRNLEKEVRKILDAVKELAEATGAADSGR